MENRNNHDIDQLNSFRRGELSAVETYDQAIEKLGGDPRISRLLKDCRESHQGRASLLRSEIERMGGEPADDSGMWGNFAQLVEGSAKVLGKKAAIAALEEGEDHGRDDYKSELDDLDLSPDVRELVQNRLLPEQLRTHQVLSDLKHTL